MTPVDIRLWAQARRAQSRFSAFDLSVALALADVAAAANMVLAFNEPDSLARQQTDQHLRSAAYAAHVELAQALTKMEALKP